MLSFMSVIALFTMSFTNPVCSLRTVKTVGHVEVEKTTLEQQNQDRFSSSPYVRAWFMAMLHSVDFGTSKKECSVWVSGTPGQYSFDPWVCDKDSYRSIATRRPSPEEWNVHTHPTNMAPWPSNGDEIVARKMGKPIYTVHKKGIWKYDPITDQRIELAGLNWYQDLDSELVWSIVTIIRSKNQLDRVCAHLKHARKADLKAKKSKNSRKIKIKSAQVNKWSRQHNLALSQYGESWDGLFQVMNPPKLTAQQEKTSDFPKSVL